MFLGHYAVAVAAKKVAPKTSLGTLFIVALILYSRATQARDRVGLYAFRAFVAFSAFIDVGNVMSRHQPPPNQMVPAVGGLSQWLLVPWTYWIDRHRVLNSVAKR